MFNVKLYSISNLLFIVIFLFQNNLQNKPLFFVLKIYQVMNSCEFKEIIVTGDFRVENGIVKLFL
jgi:hypothetical protein